MTKLKISLNDLVIDVDFTEDENNSRKITNEMTRKIVASLLQELSKEEVVSKLVNKVAHVAEGGLESAKIGDIVENESAKFDSTRYGVVVQINQKTIDVAFKNGVLRGAKESFKSCDKTFDEIKWASTWSESVGYVGQCGKFDYKGEKYDCILNKQTTKKSQFYLYELNKVISVPHGHEENYFTLLK